MRKSDRYSQRAAARLELLPGPRYGDFPADYDDFEGSLPDTEGPSSASSPFYRPQRPAPPLRSNAHPYQDGYGPIPDYPSDLRDPRARTNRNPASRIPTQDAPDQFLRSQRRVAVRKGKPVGKSLIVLLSTLAALFALGALAYSISQYLLHDDHFRLASSNAIQLTGDQHISHTQLIDVFSRDAGRNVFTIPLSDRRAALESNPWVAHATVMRLLPNRLRVIITERKPVAFTRNGSTIGLVDATGALMDLPRSNTPADAAPSAQPVTWSLPVVIGITNDLPLSTRAARMAIFNRFVADIDSAGPPLSRKLSEVDLTDPDDIKALVPDNGMDVLVHFGSTDFLNRFKSYEQHLPEWRQQYPHLASADMRYDHQVVLDMDPNATSAAVTTPAPPSAPVQTAPTVTAPAPAAKPAPSANTVVKPTVKTPPPAQLNTAQTKLAPAPLHTAPTQRPTISKTSQTKAAQLKVAQSKLTQSKLHPRPNSAPVPKPNGSKLSGSKPTTKSAHKPAAHDDDAPMVLPSITSSSKHSAAHPFVPAPVNPGAVNPSAVNSGGTQ